MDVADKIKEKLENNGGSALKGDAMGFKLGDGKLPTNSNY